MSPLLVLTSPRVLGTLRVLGPHRVLSPLRVLGPIFPVCLLIIGTMHMCPCAYIIIKNCKYSAYILDFSRKRNTIKDNMDDGVRF